MFRRIGFVSIVAAAALTLLACNDRQGEAANNMAAEAETAQTNTAPADDPQANGAGGGEGRDVPTGGVCGGFVNAQCAAETDFCKMPVGQCGAGAGTCTTKPEVCTREYAPVCGCDGKTYGNACAADVAGVSVQAEGECPKEG